LVFIPQLMYCVFAQVMSRIITKCAFFKVFISSLLLT